MRMKYTWTPYMCIIGPAALASKPFAQWIARKCFKNEQRRKVYRLCHQYLLPVILCVLVLHLRLDIEKKALTNEMEFYDPDTVQLMEWINERTSPDAVFTGSMQLLAGVKLCTGRPLTNHPHYEDKGLRERTKELYQYYARRGPSDVHELMSKYDVDYIILEDSICLIPDSENKRCRLVDTLDIDNGHIDTEGNDLGATMMPRFCDEVRHGKDEYGRLFKAVMENKTFRIYRVMKKKKH